MTTYKNKSLIRAMLEKDMGTCDLATKLHIQPTALSMYRSGYRHPPVELAKQIESTLEASNLFTSIA